MILSISKLASLDLSNCEKKSRTNYLRNKLFLLSMSSFCNIQMFQNNGNNINLWSRYWGWFTSYRRFHNYIRECAKDKFFKIFFLKKRHEQKLLSNYSTICINLNDVDVSVFQTFTLTSKCCCPDGCAGSSPPPAGGGSDGISVGTVILIVWVQ